MHLKSKFLQSWKKYITITHLENIAKEEGRVKEHKRKQNAIEQERRQRMKEVGEKANCLRNLTVLKSCFEVFKTEFNITQNLKSRYDLYSSHRKK
jgi:hypothetical protein